LTRTGAGDSDEREITLAGLMSGGAAKPTGRLPVSVIVPTIGRTELLRQCLESLAACRPGAEEIVIVDQSDAREVYALAERFADAGARRVRCDGRGTSRAMNRGLREVSHDRVLVTHDDCTVNADWVEAAERLLGTESDLIVTGRVMPVGEPASVPSIKVDPVSHDFTGERQCGALYPNNMALSREGVLALGGFDERIRYAEDNDLCYRWLRAGHRLRYHPELVVWHHDWRSRPDLTRLYRRYWHSQGVFYAKHLRGGDLAVLRFIADDARAALRLAGARLVRGRPAWPDPRSGIPLALPAGLIAGLRVDWKARPEAPQWL